MVNCETQYSKSQLFCIYIKSSKWVSLTNFQMNDAPRLFDPRAHRRVGFVGGQRQPGELFQVSPIFTNSRIDLYRLS